MKPLTEKQLQQRRFYLVLPLLVLPFITLLFWALGGGKGSTAQAQPITSGINVNLPGAHFKKDEEIWDKLSLYEQAQRDSLKAKEDKQNDPYYVVELLQGIVTQDTAPSTKGKLNTSLGAKNKNLQIASDEKEINQKLELLSLQLSKKEETTLPVGTTPQLASSPASQLQESKPLQKDDSEVGRLEKMMSLMSENSQQDPELLQIDGVLEKILDVQHPERMREKLLVDRSGKASPLKQISFASEANPIETLASPIQAASDSTQSNNVIYPNHNRFYGLTDEVASESLEHNAIDVIVHETQTLVNGSTIKMRLLSDVVLNGIRIAKDDFIFGVCSLNGERLTVSINSVRNSHSVVPVSLKVFDLEGMEGLYIPGAITRDAAKKASGETIEDIDLATDEKSLSIQAASAGIEAAKGLFSKKAKLIKVTVKAGYQLLLRDANVL